MDTGLMGTYVEDFEKWRGFRPVDKMGVHFNGVWLKTQVCHEPRSNQLRSLWAMNCLSNVSAIIFCVDLSNSKDFDEARGFLHRLLQHPDSNGKTFLVLGTKADVSPAADRCQLMTSLGLEELSQSQTQSFEVKVTPTDDRMQNQRIALYCGSSFSPSLSFKPAFMWLVHTMEEGRNLRNLMD